MRQLAITLVAITALLAGLYLSARHFAEPVATTEPAANGPLLGNIRPEFQLATLDGEFLSPADFAGKTMLINFWATWCSPCRQEMPMLMDLQREFSSKGLQVVGIALDEVQSVNKFVETFGISYPILVGSEDVFQTSDDYGNKEGVLPYSVLVDKTGVVRWQYAGIIRHADITKLLNELL